MLNKKIIVKKNIIEFFTSFFKTAIIIRMFLIVVFLYKFNLVQIGVLLSISLTAITFSTNIFGIFENIQNFKSSKDLFLKFKMKNNE
ncbi:hypothetical protein STAIW_v1c06190 [Spiroplasma taiwanense CT-1]|uniref:Uncharacterized protein n=1 Tax=Spiroplasma taiwanense CT-1 TaxID=1276220 RepID=S5MHC0_9MOLU|nr:hypothetical protein STAIW_v1c06190 [Spiroplasma taiwanense CT-1]